MEQLSDMVNPTREDWIAFLASIMSGTSSAIGANSNPTIVIFGLVIAAIGKSLPSLGDWKNLAVYQRIEDIILFISTVAGYLATSLSGNTHYVIWGIILGMIGKAIPSLINYKDDPKSRVEDVASLVIVAIGGAIYFLQNDTNSATLVLALGIISKALPSLQGKNAQPQQNDQ
ncbi:MAG: hypothetical protein KGH95_00200 [Thaumarchaeota archaeon]|nr:hypothetical protein [Nitrososphaerota archaeon]